MGSKNEDAIATTSNALESLTSHTDTNNKEHDLGHPSLSLIFSTPALSGQSLYLGGELGLDDLVYCIPGHAQQVLVINPQSDACYTIGPAFTGKFKWLRGVRTGTTIYGLPCHADSVLKIDPPSGDITTLPIPYDTFYTSLERRREQRAMPWKYHGGALSPADGCIYCVPQSALHVLRIDPQTDTCSFVGPELEGKYKWYGGVVGSTDGAIYGIPHNSPSILRIDPDNGGGGDVVTLHGDFGAGGHKWHGAAVSTIDGTIVSIPANEDSVLCITPGEPVTWRILGGPGVVSTGCHRFDRKYKFLGAVCGKDGRVYCLPSGAERALQVDTVNGTVREIGPSLAQSGMERIGQNKYQNGFLCEKDGCIYGIPLAAETVLKIETPLERGEGEVKVSTMKLPRGCQGLAKWEGGVMAKNGVMYCMPNNFKGVLRIAPSEVGEEKREETDTEVTKTLSLKTKDVVRDGETDEAADGTNKHKPISVISQESGSSDLRSKYHAATELSENVNGETLRYNFGIATLRSSAHTVKYSRKKNRGRQDLLKPRPMGDKTTTLLPLSIRAKRILQYDTVRYDLHGAVVDLLLRLDPEIVGAFHRDTVGDDRTSSTAALEATKMDATALRLECFRVPVLSLSRKDFGGQVEEAQRYLSDAVASDATFLQRFDRLVTEIVLPDLKSRLVTSGVVDGDATTTFYYQRPPTLRLQPGPARSSVKAHRDSDYGHQDGELNYWIPLTDPAITGVDLYAESDSDAGDYRPLGVQTGEMASFHGTSCRHYVNRNGTDRTRASLDFRVGVEGFFDPRWQMVGTRDDHNRIEVRL